MMAKRGFYLQTHFSCSAIYQCHSIDFYSYQYPLILNNLLLILNIIHYLNYFLAVLAILDLVLMNLTELIKVLFALGPLVFNNSFFELT